MGDPGRAGRYGGGMITRTEMLGRAAAEGGALPLLTLDEFFADNEQQESIAPNQWGYGRPLLQMIHQRLSALQEAADVAWIRIQLHEETINTDFPDISAEAVAICTSAAADEIERRLGTDFLQSDGIIEGLVYPADWFTEIPAIPEQHHLLSLVWD